MNDFERKPPRGQRPPDRFPNLRKLGVSISIDPADLSTALARATAALEATQPEEFPFTPVEHVLLLELLADLKKSNGR